MFYTKEEMEAELRRVADGLRDGSIRVSGLPFHLTVVIQSATALGQEAARMAEIPNVHARGVEVAFPIEVETPSEIAEEDDIDAFTREDAEVVFQAAMRGDALTSVYERMLDAYEPSWRTQRRQYGRSPSHPLWGKTQAPTVGVRRSALLTTPTLAVLTRHAEALAGIEATRDLTAIAVAVCSLTRAAPWAEAYRNQVRSSGDDGVVLVSVHENRPLGLADTLMEMAERERMGMLGTFERPTDAALDEAFKDEVYVEGLARQDEIVNALVALANAVKKLHAMTHPTNSEPKQAATTPKKSS